MNDKSSTGTRMLLPFSLLSSFDVHDVSLPPRITGFADGVHNAADSSACGASRSSPPRPAPRTWRRSERAAHGAGRAAAPARRRRPAAGRAEPIASSALRRRGASSGRLNSAAEPSARRPGSAATALRGDGSLPAGPRHLSRHCDGTRTRLEFAVRAARRRWCSRSGKLKRRQRARRQALSPPPPPPPRAWLDEVGLKNSPPPPPPPKASPPPPRAGAEDDDAPPSCRRTACGAAATVLRAAV